MSYSRRVMRVKATGAAETVASHRDPARVVGPTRGAGLCLHGAQCEVAIPPDIELRCRDSRPVPLLFRGVTDLPTDGVRQVVTEPHRAPCRRCLTDAEPGEEVRLVSYDPFVLDSPYRSPSPVFVHVHNARPGCFAVRVERG